MRGVSFPKETEFRSLGAGVRTTDNVASCPLILKRIGKASALLDRIHGVQGDFDDKCKVVATMVNAIGLHASEIVAISQKDIKPFETRILKAIWGASRPGRAKEIIFLPYVSGTQNCPLLASALWPRRLVGKALQNTWPSHGHSTSRMGRESPHTQVGTVWTGAENLTRLGMAPALGLVGMESAGCYWRSATDGRFSTGQAQHQGTVTVTANHPAYSQAATTICGHALSHKQEASLCQHRLLSVRTGTLAAAHSSGGRVVDSSPGAPAGHDHLPVLPILQTGR